MLVQVQVKGYKSGVLQKMSSAFKCLIYKTYMLAHLQDVLWKLLQCSALPKSSAFRPKTWSVDMITKTRSQCTDAAFDAVKFLVL